MHNIADNKCLHLPSPSQTAPSTVFIVMAAKIARKSILCMLMCSAAALSLVTKITRHCSEYTYRNLNNLCNTKPLPLVGRPEIAKLCLC